MAAAPAEAGRRASDKGDELGDHDEGAKLARTPVPFELAQCVQQKDAHDACFRFRVSTFL